MSHQVAVAHHFLQEIIDSVRYQCCMRNNLNLSMNCELEGLNLNTKYALWGWNFGGFTWWGQATLTFEFVNCSPKEGVGSIFALNLWIALLKRGLDQYLLWICELLYWGGGCIIFSGTTWCNGRNATDPQHHNLDMHWKCFESHRQDYFIGEDQIYDTIMIISIFV